MSFYIHVFLHVCMYPIIFYGIVWSGLVWSGPGGCLITICLLFDLVAVHSSGSCLSLGEGAFAFTLMS